MEESQNLKEQWSVALSMGKKQLAFLWHETVQKNSK